MVQSKLLKMLCWVIFMNNSAFGFRVRSSRSLLRERHLAIFCGCNILPSLVGAASCRDIKPSAVNSRLEAAPTNCRFHKRPNPTKTQAVIFSVVLKTAWFRI
jgi:hypothetical protein